MKANPDLMLINPKSGSLGKQASPDNIKKVLDHYGLFPEIHVASSNRSITQFVKTARERRPHSVFIAGGDGTIGAVLKGLIDVPLRFGLIPTGSLNNLSSTLSLYGDLEQAVRVIKASKTRHFDAARAGSDIMFEALGLGMFAEIMDRTDWDKEKKVGQLVAQSAIQVVTQKTIRITANIDGNQRQFETIWLAVTNTPKLGALTLDPTERIDDGILELLYCRPLTALELPKYALSFMKGDHLQEEKFERIRGKHIRLSFARGTNVHIDDRIHQRSRLDIQVLPHALEIFAP